MKRLLNVLCGIILASLMACMPSNTMYNARNYFKSAQAKPLNTNGKPNAQAIEEYTKAIKKCGIIISERKKGSQLDDAVFLMAKALYYKGNSAFQAKDQFENLLRSFPNSPFVPESHIYLAKVLREINQPKEADKTLDEFVRNPRFHKDHPKALLLMADFAIKDKDFARAQYWLERIIRDYPKTKEYREAYFLFGKNYYEQNDYTRSLEAFEKMQTARGIDRELKLNASYYIALNNLELNNLDDAFRTIRNLIRVESRPDKLAAVRLLKARIQFARGENKDAESDIDIITKNYPRTESAAAAYYFLAEQNYYRLGDANTAIINYNKVRTEFSASPYAALGQNKATALGQVLPDSTLNSETGLTQFVNHYYQAAEGFLNYLALPDSAMASYRRVIREKDNLVAKRDSLRLLLRTNQNSTDSLQAWTNESSIVKLNESNHRIEESYLNNPALPDSTRVFFSSIVSELDILKARLGSMQLMVNSLQSSLESLRLLLPTPVPADSTEITTITDTTSTADITNVSAPIEADSLVSIASIDVVPQADSIEVTFKPEADSLAFASAGKESDSVSDSLKVSSVAETPQADPETIRLTELLKTEIKAKEARLESLSATISRFDTEIIPFCMFAIGSVLHDHYPDSSRNAELMAEMQSQFANNKFTKALYALQNGQTVRLIDPEEEAVENQLGELFGRITTEPDSAIAGIKGLLDTKYPAIKLAANYRLGWYYSFEAVDTLVAKPYLDAVLKDALAGDYAVITHRFYDGKNFLMRGTEIPAFYNIDSLSTSIADSLGVLKGIPSFMDSLAMNIPPSLAVPDSLRKYLPSFIAMPDSLSAPADSLNLAPPDLQEDSQMEVPAELDLPIPDKDFDTPIIKEEETPLE